MSRSNKDIVREFMATARTGDVAALRSLFHPEFRIVEADGLPYGGTRHGVEGLLGLVHEVFSTWKDCSVQVQQLVAEDDCVIVLAEMTGVGRADPTPFCVPIAELYRIRDGRIVEIRPFYFDTKRLHDAHFGRDRG
jgi:ketosteroid isomerase-like protein